MTAEKIIQESAKLRGQRKFKEAIALIEENREQFDDITLVPALIQAFEAAKELGDAEATKHYAVELAAHEPELPSIQPFIQH